jgi:hypothetical protein
MSTAAELRVEYERLLNEETRLRSQYDAFGSQISSLSDQQRPINAEIRNQRSIIQDPNASEAQKSAATIRGQELESQYNNIDRQINLIRDQQRAFLDSGPLGQVQKQLYTAGSGLRDRIKQAEQQEQREASAAEAKKNEEDALAAEKEAADIEARERARVAGQPVPEDTQPIGDPTPANESQNQSEVQENESDSTATTTKETDGNVSSPSGSSGVSSSSNGTGGGQPNPPPADPPDYGHSTFSGVYKIITIKNTFEGGKFEQTLNLVRLSDLEKEFNQQKKDIAETKEAIENKRQEIEPLLRVKTLPEAQFAGTKLLVAKKDGGLDVFKAAESAINEGIDKASSLSDDFASSISDGFKSITDGISGGVTDITSTLGGGIDKLVNLGSDASIPYEGDDPIVIERLARQRAAQGIQVDDAVNRDN